MVARALDAAHNKRRIAIILHEGQSLAVTAAEQWAGQNGVLLAELEDASHPDVVFDLADSVIAFPGTSQRVLDAARERGVKVWEPYKISNQL